MRILMRNILLWCALVGSLTAGVSAFGPNETPSSHLAVVTAPGRFERPRGEDTFLEETGSPDGQRYITLSLQQTSDPGLFPVIDLLDHMERIDGTYSTGVLLHTGHGGMDHSILMESFKGTDAQAAAACQNRLNEYAAAGWDITGADREIEAYQQEAGWWSIYMFDRAVRNRGGGMATDHPLVYIATCYGSLVGPAYKEKGARVVLGSLGCIQTGVNATQVETFFKRLNGREGQAKRTVEKARSGLTLLWAMGSQNTTLAPSVLKLDAPCPIRIGDLVTFTLDTTCEMGIAPDIEGAGCTIENETWLSSTTLQGTCTDPGWPGSTIFSLTLPWELVYSDNNTARLDGNNDPAGVNARGPAHDDYDQSFICTPGPDFILVLDRSGSMGYEDKLIRAKAAARYFVDNTRSRDQLGVVSFSSLSSLVAPLTFIPEPWPDHPVKQLLKSAIYTITPEGNTNFGAGLQTAFDQLVGSPGPKKFTVFMSDGHHNTGTYEGQVAAFQAMGWPIFTVGFGEDADGLTLTQIAVQTGGMYFPATVTDIQAIYDLIQGITIGASALQVSHGWINQGQTVVGEVDMPGAATAVQFSLFWPTWDLDLTLTAPDGSAVTPEIAADRPGMAYFETGSYAYYEINSPMPGVWETRATGTEVPGAGSEYCLNVIADAGISANLLAFDPVYEIGDPVVARVNLRECAGDSWNTVMGARVIGRMLQPDGTVELLALYDTGAGGDEVASDGTYSGIFQDTRVKGSYALGVTVTGSSGTGTFEAELNRTVQVGDYDEIGISGGSLHPAPGSVLETSPPLISASVVGPSELIDASSIVLTVDGSVVSRAYDAGMQTITWEPSAPLTEGPHTVTLDLSDAQGTAVPRATWVFSVGAYSAVESTDLEKSAVLSLYPAMPNPFSRTTEIRFGLPEARPVKLTVHDVHGRLVRSLVSGMRPAREHSFHWDGTDDSGHAVSPGVYFIRLEAGSDVVTKKILRVQ